MSHFEPRRVFRRARLQTLHAYFDHRQIALDIPWDNLADTDWRTVVDAWARLPDETNALVAADFYDFAVMAEEAGVRALLEACLQHGSDWTLVLATVDDPLTTWSWQWIPTRRLVATSSTICGIGGFWLSTVRSLKMHASARCVSTSSAEAGAASR
jgi:hypothetical protein